MPKKLTYEEVKEVFESKGNKLVSTKYVNSDTPLEYICDCGRLDKKRVYEFKKGSRCKICGIEKNHKTQRLTYEEVKHIFEEQGNELISTEYINSNVPLEYICDCGRLDKKRVGSFRRGQRCQKCKEFKVRKKRALPFEEVKKSSKKKETN